MPLLIKILSSMPLQVWHRKNRQHEPSPGVCTSQRIAGFVLEGFHRSMSAFKRGLALNGTLQLAAQHSAQAVEGGQLVRQGAMLPANLTQGL